MTRWCHLREKRSQYSRKAKQIYTRVVKRLKWIAPVDQNIDFTGLRATIREVAAILKSFEQQLMWLQAHLDSRLPIPFTSLNQDRTWDRDCVFFLANPSDKFIGVKKLYFCHSITLRTFGLQKISALRRICRKAGINFCFSVLTRQVD